jgi:hypothetical protein
MVGIKIIHSLVLVEVKWFMRRVKAVPQHTYEAQGGEEV